MKWNRLKDQKGLSFLEFLFYGALLALVAYAGFKYFSNPESRNPVRAYENPLAK